MYVEQFDKFSSIRGIL